MATNPVTDCIFWLGGRKNRKGYGIESRVDPWSGVQRMAHRMAWEECIGPIPEGMQVLHRCDKPACVNPEHLFLGTNKDNVADRVRKGRSSRRFGQLNPAAKISDDERHWLRKTVLAGATQVWSSLVFNVRNTRVSQIMAEEWHG